MSAEREPETDFAGLARDAVGEKAVESGARKDRGRSGGSNVCERGQDAFRDECLANALGHRLQVHLYDAVYGSGFATDGAADRRRRRGAQLDEHVVAALLAPRQIRDTARGSSWSR